MDRFWIIPIVALVSGSIIGVGAIEYKVNTVWPNAIIELDEIKSMNCESVNKKIADGRTWTPQNGVALRTLGYSCQGEKVESIRNPYVAFCNPNDDFAPVKLIQNSTHKFNHVICEWKER